MLIPSPIEEDAHSTHSIVNTLFIVAGARRHVGHLGMRQRELHVTPISFPGAGFSRGRQFLFLLRRVSQQIAAAAQFADFGVDLFRFWRRRGGQRRQAISNLGIRRIHVRAACEYFEDAGRDGTLHLLPGRRLRCLHQIRFRLETGVPLGRSHTDLRSYGEREGRRLLGRVPASVTLRYPRDPVEEAIVVADTAAVAPVADRRLLDVLQTLLQTLQYRLRFGLRFNLLQVQFFQLTVVGRRFRRSNSRLGRPLV